MHLRTPSQFETVDRRMDRQNAVSIGVCCTRRKLRRLVRQFEWKANAKRPPWPPLMAKSRRLRHHLDGIRFHIAHEVIHDLTDSLFGLENDSFSLLVDARDGVAAQDNGIGPKRETVPVKQRRRPRGRRAQREQKKKQQRIERIHYQPNNRFLIYFNISPFVCCHFA